MVIGRDWEPAENCSDTSRFFDRISYFFGGKYTFKLISNNSPTCMRKKNKENDTG